MDVMTDGRIVGGMLGLPESPDPNSTSPPFLKEGSILLVNGRSGVFLASKYLSARRVWMPSYVCRSVEQAARASGVDTRFYEVDYNLVVRSLEWLNEVQKGDLVVVVDYFGFPCDPSIANAAKDRGAIVLEDATQALLSTYVGQCTDVVVLSPRKFVGVPDGGILLFNNGYRIDDVRLALPPQKWWGKALCAGVGRTEFDRMGGSRRWFHLFQEAETECPIGRYAMSGLTKSLLTQGFNYQEIAQKRIDNYKFLAGKLGHVALFREPLQGVVPLGFPIRVENRNQIREALFKQEIYAAVHWAIDGVVPEEFSESHRLAAEILTLPCDQRYGREDMERMAEIVLQGMTQ